MLPKIKRYIKNNKKQVAIVLAVIAGLLVCLVLYKALFYSSSEKAVYGVRLRDIKENEFVKEDKKEVLDKGSEIEGVSNVKIEVKGRLIKFFVTFNEGVSTDDMKNKFNEMLGFISSKVTSYYDISFYSKQTVEGKTKYPVTGYKHKGKSEISFDVL